MNHTPGPWKIERRTTPGEFVTDTFIVSKNKSVLADVGPCNIEGNARLFAAAPSLLTALVMAKKWMDADADIMENLEAHDREIYDATMEAINNAIQQATQQ